MATWPGYVEFPRQPLLHAQQAARPAGEECFTPSVGDEAAQDPLDIGGPAGAFRIRHRDDLGALTPEQIDRNEKLRPACAENGRDRRPVCLGRFCQRRQCRKTRPPADGNDVTQRRIEFEASAKRSHDVELVAGAKDGEAARAGAGDLVKEFDLPPFRVGAVKTHRAAQERLFTAGLRAEQLEKLPGSSTCRNVPAANDEMAVFLVHLVVRQDFSRTRPPRSATRIRRAGAGSARRQPVQPDPALPTRRNRSDQT